MPPLLKVLLRQLKTSLFLLLHLLRRLCCCRAKGASTCEPGSEEILVEGNFVVVQQNDDLQNCTTTQYAPSSPATYEPEVALEGWDPMGPASGPSKGPAFSYSNYSLVNQQTAPQFSSNRIGSRIDIGPNRQHYGQQQQQQQSDETVQEEDFFQDMTPKFRKPKTIYVQKETEIRQEDLQKKFQIDNRKFVQLDETKFKPFGALEEAAGGYSGSPGDEGGTSWEDMASEETAWGDLDANLVALRRETREQRMREAQEQRRLKQQQQQQSSGGQFARKMA